MDHCIYTNRGKEVPLGVECAMPYLVHSAPSNVRGGAQRAWRTLHLVQEGRRAVTAPDPVHP